VWWLDDLFGLCRGANDAELGDGEVGGFAGRWWCIPGNVVFLRYVILLLKEILEAIHGAG
jgi:hypothetical protein